MSYLVPFCSCVFSPFSIAITSLWEERANLSAFRMFDRFVHVWICRFPLPLDVWEGLMFVIVALPGLFSYLFLSYVTFLLPLFREASFPLSLGRLCFLIVLFSGYLLCLPVV